MFWIKKIFTYLLRERENTTAPQYQWVGGSVLFSHHLGWIQVISFDTGTFVL